MPCSLIYTNISEELVSSLLLWRRRQQVVPKHWHPLTAVHSVTYQKTMILEMKIKLPLCEIILKQISHSTWAFYHNSFCLIRMYSYNLQPSVFYKK
jgi:hypothetical protein